MDELVVSMTSKWIEYVFPLIQRIDKLFIQSMLSPIPICIVDVLDLNPIPNASL